MAEEKYTRCPECRTVYRVTDEQLAQRSGRVRCGHCQVVFDGVAELVAPAAPEAFTGRDDTLPGQPAPAPQMPFAPQALEPSIGQAPWQDPRVEATRPAGAVLMCLKNYWNRKDWIPRKRPW